MIQSLHKKTRHFFILPLVFLLILATSGCCTAPSRIDTYVGRLQFGRTSSGCSGWSSALAGNSVGLQRNEGILKGKIERFSLLPIFGAPFRYSRAKDLLRKYPWEMSSGARRLRITLPSSPDVASLLQDAYDTCVWPEDRIDRLVKDLARGYFISVDLMEIAIKRQLLDSSEAQRRTLLLINKTFRNGRMCYPLHGSNRHFLRRLHELGLLDKCSAENILRQRFVSAKRLHCDEIQDMEYFGIIPQAYADIFFAELYFDLWNKTLKELECATATRIHSQREIEKLCSELNRFRTLSKRFLKRKQSFDSNKNRLLGRALQCETLIHQAKDIFQQLPDIKNIETRQTYRPSVFWAYTDPNGAIDGWTGRERSLDETIAIFPLVGPIVTFPVRFLRGASGVTLSQWLYEKKLEGATSKNSIEILQEVDARGIMPKEEINKLFGCLAWLQFEYYRDFGAICVLSRTYCPLKVPQQMPIHISPCARETIKHLHPQIDSASCLEATFTSWVLDTYFKHIPPEYWSYEAAKKGLALKIIPPDLPEAILRRDICNLRIGATLALYLDFHAGPRKLKLERKLVERELREATQRICAIHELIQH